MATRLKNLTVDRVDLVDIGANLDKRTGDGAHIMLYKRADQSAKPADLRKAALARIVAMAKAKGASAGLLLKTESLARTFDDVLAAQEAREALSELWELYYAFQEAACSILDSDEADKIGLINASAADFMSAFLGALPSALDEASVEMGVEKVGRKISGKRMKQLREMHEKLGSLLAEVTDEGDGEMSKTAEQIAADATAQADVQKRIDDGVAKAVADTKKAADEHLAAELKKRDDEIAKALGEAKAERDARILKDFQGKTTTDFVGLPLTLVAKAAGEKTDAEVFKALSEKAPDEWLRVEAILKGAAEAIRNGQLFKEQGGAGAESATSAAGQLQALAQELVTKGLQKTLEQAIAAVAVDPAHRDLYKRYVEEQRSSTRH